MTHTGLKLRHAPNSALSLKHLTGSALIISVLSIGASLLNGTSWGSGSISILWPSTGLLIGIILCVPRRQWPVYIAAGFVIDLTVNTLFLPHSLFSVDLYLAGCNIIEVSLAAWLLYPSLAPQRDLTQARQLVNLLVYGVILSPAIASLFASVCIMGYFGKPTLSAFADWFTGDALGISIVTPLYLGLQKQSPFSKRRWYEVTCLFVLLCTVSILVFWQTSLPLLFVILPFLLLVEIRLGLAGSAMGLLAVSMIGGYFTARGHGPIGLTLFVSLSARTLTLQFFIFVCMSVLYIVEVVRAERNRFELNLRNSEQRFRILAEESHDIIMLRDLQREIQYISPAIQVLLGWKPEEFIEMDNLRLVHPDDQPSLEKLYEECLAGKAFNSLDFRLQRRAGDYLWMEANLVLHRDPETGESAGFINVIRDISSRKATEDELNKALNVAENLANIDALTGVANRRGFDECMESEWRRAIRRRTSISVLLIDVDHFKLYNDTYGHVCGDNCLKAVAEALASDVRRPDDFLARYGGEEFVIVLPNTDADGAQSVAEQIRGTVELRRIQHEGNPHRVVTISIGCATQSTPKLGSLYTQLLESADEGLYLAKSSGRNCVKQAG